MKGEYGVILMFFIISVGISFILEGLSYVLSEQKGDREKLTAYECGFDAFEDARSKFDVRFYLVGMLFIIFDLEASFLFPWSVALEKIGEIGYWGMIDFLFELCIGYLYAWRVGALTPRGREEKDVGLCN